MRKIFVLAALLLSPLAARAECADIIVKTSGGAAFTDVDISGGAVTTGAISVQHYAEVIIRGELTDASDGISNLNLLIKESGTSSGTFTALDRCTESAGAFTCVLSTGINRDPRNAGQGKSLRLTWPVIGKFWKITATPTGQGAGDALTVSMMGCY